MLLQFVETIALIPAFFVAAILTAQLVILAFPRHREHSGSHTPSVTVLMPAHNEGAHIANAIRRVLGSGYEGKLELIVINDGSTDNTQDEIVPFLKDKRVRVLRTEHVGKSNAMNAALKLSKGDLVLTIDADTFVEPGAIGELVAPFSDGSVAVTTGTLKAANSNGILTWFQKVEYCYYAFYKLICGRVGGMIWALGPLSAFRRKELVKSGGFDNKLYAEDIDICLKMASFGKAVYVPKAISSTAVPDRLGPFWRQRLRWSKADIQIAKKFRRLYFRKKNAGAGFFSLPVMSYWYFHGAAMVFLIALQIGLGYNQYYLASGQGISLGAAQFFFDWATIFGVINLAINNALGTWQPTMLSVMTVIGAVESYSLYIVSMKWMKERIGAKEAFAFVFFFPYWIVNMLAQLWATPEWFRGEGRNW